MTKICLMSDTHGSLPPNIYDYIADVDEIWHAGDIGSTEVLQRLRELKPTRAVYGNCDSGDVRYSLSEFYRFKVEDTDILMTHIGGHVGHYNSMAYSRIMKEKPNVFVCGHSHILRVEYDKSLNMLCLNPGALGNYGIHTRKTMLRFVIDKNQIQDLEVVDFGEK